MKIFVALALALATASLMSCVSKSQAPADEADRAPSSIASDLSYMELKSWLEQPGVSSIDQILGRVAKKYPGYMRHYALAYQSLSLHGSSFENPRAIVFGGTGNLILTFNGTPSQKSYANLELVTFDERQGYQFREVTFKKEPQAKPSVEANEIEFQNTIVAISKPNPQVCMQCHTSATGTRALPIWQTYFVWPGVYGSEDDFLYRMGDTVGDDNTNEFHKINSSVGRVYKLPNTAADEELQGYERYMKLKTQNARYKYLSERPHGLQFDNRPNLSLLTLIDRQIEKLMFNDLMNKRPTDFGLQTFTSAYCSDGDPKKPNAVTARIKGNLNLAKPRIIKDRREAIFDDLERMRINFKFKITSANGNKSAIYEGAKEDDSDRDTASMEAGLKEMGLQLSDYSYNLRRYRIFDTGEVDSFHFFLRDVFAEMKRRNLKSEDCPLDADLSYE